MTDPVDPPPPARSKRWRWRASSVTLAAGLALMVLVSAGAAFAALLLRSHEIEAWKQQASTMALLLAEQTFESLSSADLLLESVTRDIGRRPPRDSAELRRRVVVPDMSETLRDRSAALPLVDVVAIISPEGELLNYSRAWPPAKFKVDERDYFQVLSRPGAPRSFLGEPVRSKVNGNWVIFLARRFENRAGGFGGLVLVGLSVPGISEFFARVGQELGPGATLSLLRRDFTLVARHPFDPAEMGKANPSGSAAEVVERQRSRHGVVMRPGNGGPGATGEPRMAAVRVVDKYPLIVNVSIPESVYLASWQRSVRTIAWVAGASLLAIGTALVMLVRLQRRREVDRAAAQVLQLQAQAARAASEAKSQFLSMISHEIRTPLNGVIGANLLLRQTALDAHQHELVRASALSADALMALIDDVLDFSRIEAGKLELDSVDVDLIELVDDAVELLAPRAEAKGLVVAGWVEPGVPARLRGDPARIRQVLLNLLGNAIKFTEHGEVTLRVDLHSADAAAPMLRFQVSDTGIGIAADRTDQLFQVFAQVDPSARRRHGGSGLGLAISKRLVEAMQGRIGVRSTLGLGSVFWFELPLRPAAAPAEESPASLWQGIGPRRVLLVDASAGRRRALQLLLSEAGCEVLVERDAASALRRQERHASGRRAIDLIVFAPAPGSPLGELPVRRPRRADGKPVPAIVLTHAVLARGDAAPAGAVTLAQPVRRANLARALREALGLEPGPSQPAPPPQPAEASPAGARVLLVEDNDVNRMVAEQMLILSGHRVDCAEDGQRALALLSRSRYDVVLMDCQMPGMDGFEATRAIRQGRSGVLDPDVPIVALTANVMRGDQEAALAAGMNDFLTKPVDVEHLAGAVRRWMGRP
jgi:signal transduction histidine kinase/CheY-like chemotaxis protein